MASSPMSTHHGRSEIPTDNQDTQTGEMPNGVGPTYKYKNLVSFNQ